MAASPSEALDAASLGDDWDGLFAEDGPVDASEQPAAKKQKCSSSDVVCLICKKTPD